MQRTEHALTVRRRSSDSEQCDGSITAEGPMTPGVRGHALDAKTGRDNREREREGGHLVEHGRG